MWTGIGGTPSHGVSDAVHATLLPCQKLGVLQRPHACAVAGCHATTGTAWQASTCKVQQLALFMVSSAVNALKAMEGVPHPPTHPPRMHAARGFPSGYAWGAAAHVERGISVCPIAWALSETGQHTYIMSHMPVNGL
jgi:hypothetical protein